MVLILKVNRVACLENQNMNKYLQVIKCLHINILQIVGKMFFFFFLNQWKDNSLLSECQP